jgi:BirA family transcriptional regulator, biotin operon repressor / biotin---[acetyl-CoA-carboxylase] ligase
MEFTEESLNARLRGKTIGHAVHFYREVGSTNTRAYELAISGAPEGAVVVADTQRAGKGRLNRAWQSPPGTNLYVSVILRPRIEPVKAPQLTLMAGVVVAEVFSFYCPEGVSIKWPNDVLIWGKKACGILTEMKTSSTGVDFIILGIGLNVNMDREDFDPTLRDTATSLKIETGKEHDRLDVLSRLFDFIEKWYKVFLSAGFAGLRDTWMSRADILGKRIKVDFKNDFQTGTVTGIDDDGAILMKCENGIVQRVIAGDVHSLGR